MAPLKSPAIFLAISLLFLLSQPTYSQTCKSQKFSNKKTFKNCLDLPYLNASLHWTYDDAKSSLSMGYVAPPAKTDGWVAWAINPTATGMVGSQALLAFKQSDGKMSVQTFNIKSYSSLQEGPLSFNVSDMSAESSNGNMMIFANWALPEKTSKINQIWQAGPTVANGVPEKHDFSKPNLNSKGTLKLAEAPSSEPVSAPAPAAAPEAGGGKSNAGECLVKNVGFVGVVVLGALAFLI
ncbi:hypothetical protein Ancab_019958 [Ancistrocladus abbreviatus]